MRKCDLGSEVSKEQLDTATLRNKCLCAVRQSSLNSYLSKYLLLTNYVRHVMQSLYWPHHVGMGPCVLKRVVGTEARLKAGTLTIFYCVTSTEKKKALCNELGTAHLHSS